MWDSDTCTCTCRHRHACGPGARWDQDTCSCVQDAASSSLQCVPRAPPSPSTRVYLVNLVLLSLAVAAVAGVLGALLLLRCCSAAWPREAAPSPPQHPGPGHEAECGDLAVLPAQPPYSDYTLTLVTRRPLEDRDLHM